jgi:beta-phosphoglucomutase-like phosphatase (HAD superfamily)
MPAPIILLEFDDVVVETRSRRAAALRSAVGPLGVELPDETFEAVCDGLSFAGAARMAFRAAGTVADETAIEIAALQAGRAFSQSVAGGAPLAPGAGEFVHNAGGQARLGLVTRAARRDVDALLALAGLADSFECVVTAEDYSGPEPSPEPYEVAVVRMAHRAPVVVGETVALVASLNAVAAARAAHVQPIVVGQVSPTLAFAGDGYIVSLRDTTVRDVLRLAAAGRTA